MATIYLIRHGQASFDKEDYDQLSSLGFIQARTLGETFRQRNYQPRSIISGSMRRHRETACESLQALGLDNNAVEYQSLWNEFDHQNLIAAVESEWVDISIFRQHIRKQKDPERYFMSIFSQAITRWTGGEFDEEYKESWPAFKQRVRRGLDTMLEALSDDEQALVYTSGGPISCLIMSLLDIPDAHLLKINRSLVNCGVTKLITNRSGIFLSSINDHSAFDSADRKHLITYK